MAEVFNFHIQEDRSIKYKLLEPIMQEDKDVATWRFRIPKVLNQIDMSRWSWWFVYVNAKGQEYSKLLTLTDDIDEPASYSTADYDIDYGISKFPGSFSFALEAINTSQGGEISGEWHTQTYSHKVDKTLQGNQAEYAETESDVISALMQEVRTKMNQVIGGATPLPVNLKSLMTNHDKVYLYIGSETGESTGYWYYWNGTEFVPGGLYAAGIQIDSTLSQSGQAADAASVGKSINGLLPYNAVGVLSEYGTFRDSTSANVTFQWVNGECIVNGAGNGYNNNIIYNEASKLPRGIEAGKTYKTIANTTNENLVLDIRYYAGDSDKALTYVRTDGFITIPDNATGLFVRMRCLTDGTIFDNDKIFADILTAYPNVDLKDYIDSSLESGLATNVDFARALVERIERSLFPYNAVGILSEYGTFEDATSGDITFNWENGECIVNGTSSGLNFNNIYTNPNGFPEGIEAGGTYKVIVKTTSQNVGLDIRYFAGGESSIALYTAITEDRFFTVPANATGLHFRLRCPTAGAQFNNDRIAVDVVNAYTNKELKDYIDSSLIPENSRDSRYMALIVSYVLKKMTVLKTLPKEYGVLTPKSYYNAGDVLKGIIYSSVWRDGLDIYRNLTLETYYSALDNPASVLYTKEYDKGIYNAHSYYGGVCSSLVWFITNQKLYRLADFQGTVKDQYNKYDLEVNDVLRKPGHVAIISNIYVDKSGNISSVEVFEQAIPVARKTIIPISEWNDFIDTNNYTVERLDMSDGFRTIEQPEYNNKVIFERGNNTYATLGEINTNDAWFYIPDATSVYIKYNNGEWSKIEKSSLPAKTVNDTTVYDLSQYIVNVGDYLITDNVDNRPCLLRIVNTGTCSISNGVLSLSGWSDNCVPCAYYIVNLTTAGNGDGTAFDPPEGYAGVYRQKCAEINVADGEVSKAITIPSDWLPANVGYKVWVDYDTGVGLKQVFSNNVLYEE